MTEPINTPRKSRQFALVLFLNALLLLAVTLAVALGGSGVEARLMPSLLGTSYGLLLWGARLLISRTPHRAALYAIASVALACAAVAFLAHERAYVSVWAISAIACFLALWLTGRRSLTA